MAIEYFCAYHSYLDSMEELNDTERGRLFTACLIYSKTGEAPQLRGNERFVFPTLKAQIDRDKATYDSRCKKNSDNIRKRWNTDVYDGEQPCTNDTKTKEKEKTKEKAKDNYIPPSVVCGELPSSPRLRQCFRWLTARILRFPWRWLPSCPACIPPWM